MCYYFFTMFYQTSSWQKLRTNVFDAGGKVIFVRQPFLTSPMAILLGGAIIVFGATYLPAMIVSETADTKPFFIGIAILEAALGIWLIVQGLKGKRERIENGGVHPKDVLHMLDASSGELRRRIGGVEERLTDFANLQMNVKIQRGKHTSYHLELAWPEHHLTVVRGTSKKDIEALIADLRQRINLAPEPTPQQ